MSTQTRARPERERLWIEQAVDGVTYWRREAGAIVAEIHATGAWWVLEVFRRMRDDSPRRRLYHGRHLSLPGACDFAAREWFYE